MNEIIIEIAGELMKQFYAANANEKALVQQKDFDSYDLRYLEGVTAGIARSIKLIDEIVQSHGIDLAT